MGGRGAASGLKSNNSPFSIPKVSGSDLKKMSRKQLETMATAIYANRSMKSGLSKSEGVRRAKSLMSGNTDAQLRKYIKKYGGS